MEIIACGVALSLSARSVAVSNKLVTNVFCSSSQWCDVEGYEYLCRPRRSGHQSLKDEGIWSKKRVGFYVLRSVWGGCGKEGWGGWWWYSACHLILDPRFVCTQQRSRNIYGLSHNISNKLHPPEILTLLPRTIACSCCSQELTRSNWCYLTVAS